MEDKTGQDKTADFTFYARSGLRSILPFPHLTSPHYYLSVKHITYSLSLVRRGKSSQIAPSLFPSSPLPPAPSLRAVYCPSIFDTIPIFSFPVSFESRIASHLCILLWLGLSPPPASSSVQVQPPPPWPTVAAHDPDDDDDTHDAIFSLPHHE